MIYAIYIVISFEYPFDYQHLRSHYDYHYYCL